jgi:hypothetical protein
MMHEDSDYPCAELSESLFFNSVCWNADFDRVVWLAYQAGVEVQLPSE